MLKDNYLQDLLVQHTKPFLSLETEININFCTNSSLALLQILIALKPIHKAKIRSLPVLNPKVDVGHEIQDLELRQKIIAQARLMNESHINQGTSGNISGRTENGFLLTPSGQSYSTMQPQDIVFMDMEGSFYGLKNPSSEWQFHRAIYLNRPDAKAVLHAHSLFCTALSVHHLPIPNFHYMVAVAGGTDIRCAKYATFGSKQLSDNIIEALQDRCACLMSNHGMVCYSAAGIDKVFGLAVEVENLAQQYWYSL